MTPSNFQQRSNFIWSVADLLRGSYRPPQYKGVMLPLTVLRRVDAVLAPARQTVTRQIMFENCGSIIGETHEN